MLFIILLLEGFISISVEILCIRQLMPFFGGSVVITSIIIGVFLLFLALGYWRGGMHQQDFFKILSRNFTFSMVWIGIGLSYSFLVFYYYITVYQASLPYLLSLTCYLLLVLAPIVYWLGQTIPITTNLFRQQHRVSYISGRALCLSTVGSFLGSLLSTLLLFHYLGVAWTVVINGMLLFVLVFLIQRESGLSWWQGLWLLLALVFIMIVNLDAENAQFKRTNTYANYRVIESKAFDTLFQINHSSSSYLSASQKAFPYIEFIRDLLFNQRNIHHKQMLVIGAGGFSLTAAGTNDNEVTYVDIDPDIKKIAETHFLKHPIHGTFVAEDARSFLRRVHTQFDVIISDVYSHQTTIPPFLLSVEYFESVANHLHANGLFIMNLIASPSFADAYARIVWNTIHAVFPYCTIVPLDWKMSASNVIYICPKVEANHVIYRDDLNNAALDYVSANF